MKFFSHKFGIFERKFSDGKKIIWQFSDSQNLGWPIASPFSPMAAARPLLRSSVSHVLRRAAISGAAIDSDVDLSRRLSVQASDWRTIAATSHGTRAMKPNGADSANISVIIVHR